MKCVICKHGDLEDGRTTLLFQRDTLMLVVKDVPASVCATCGEAYVSDETAARVEAITAEAVSTGAQVLIAPYAAA